MPRRRGKCLAPTALLLSLAAWRNHPPRQPPRAPNACEALALRGDVMHQSIPGDTGFERLKALLRKAPGAPLWSVLYNLRSKSGRNRALLYLERPRDPFQPEPTTAENRYPVLFQFVRDHL